MKLKPDWPIFRILVIDDSHPCIFLFFFMWLIRWLRMKKNLRMEVAIFELLVFEWDRRTVGR